jgi:outer membrane protein OmpA-like peptidoglycan-associated protein
MKKIVILVALILMSTLSYGQYNKWAVEAEVGTFEMNLPTGLVSANALGQDGYHLGVAGRYNFNPKFGVGLVGGFNNLSVERDNMPNLELNYYRADVEAYINIFKMLDLNPKWFTMLVHGGVGMSWIDAEDGLNENIENLSGGVTGLFKVSNRMALKLDFTTTGNIGQTKTIFGDYDSQNSGISSTVHDLSVGVVVYFGKKKENKDKLQPHADWYVAPVVEPTIINTYNKTVYPKTFVTNVIEKTCDCEFVQNEYVFFDHDKFNIKDTELNAIYKVYEVLMLNKDFTLIIKGWASPTSSSDDYNLKLSENRSNEVYQKYIDMGIDGERIRFESFGKDHKYDEQTVHDVARRVELLLVRDN